MGNRTFIGTSVVSLTTEDSSGLPKSASTVTLAATAHDGTVVTIASVVANAGGAGVHTAQMTVPNPTIVTLAWTVDSVVFYDTIPVQRSGYVTVMQLRGSDPTLQDKTAAQLSQAIEWAELECEDICNGRAFRPKYQIAEGRVANSYVVNLGLPDIRRIGTLSYIDAFGALVTVDTADATPIGGTLISVGTIPQGARVVAGIEYGLDEPPADVVDAILVRARTRALRPGNALYNYSERITIGEYNQVTRLLPGQWSTGVSEIDAIYRRRAWAGGMGFA